MKRMLTAAAAVLLLCAILSIAQKPGTVAVWDGKAYRPVFVTRRYGVKLLPHPTLKKAWSLPANSRNVEIYVNGVHFWPDFDYKLINPVIISTADNMRTADDVRASYDE